MLSYLDTIGRLTNLRDDLRTVLSTESADRQHMLEETERRLSTFLGELVTPDPELCNTCLDNDAETAAVGIDDTGAGVCEGHIAGTLLAGRGVRTSLDAAQKFADRMARLGL